MILLTGTFFCVTTATLSFPRTAMLVMPAALTALKAYSTEQRLIEHQKTHLGTHLQVSCHMQGYTARESHHQLRSNLQPQSEEETSCSKRMRDSIVDWPYPFILLFVCHQRCSSREMELYQLGTGDLQG